VTISTSDRALLVAIAIIAAKEKMEINELSADLLTLAYAFVSRSNEDAAEEAAK
jgi:hypothetical protein